MSPSSHVSTRRTGAALILKYISLLFIRTLSPCGARWPSRGAQATYLSHDASARAPQGITGNRKCSARRAAGIPDDVVCAFSVYRKSWPSERLPRTRPDCVKATHTSNTWCCFHTGCFDLWIVTTMVSYRLIAAQPEVSRAIEQVAKAAIVAVKYNLKQ